MFQAKLLLRSADHRPPARRMNAPPGRAACRQCPGGTPQHHAAGRTFALSGDAFWVVQSGALWIMKLDYCGRQTPLALLGPQMVFSRRLVSPSGYYFAQAETDVESLVLDWPQIQRSDALTAQVNGKLVDLLLHMEAWLALRCRGSTVERLRDFLLLLAEQFGRPGPRGVRLNLHLTHAQIGMAIGKERVTVSGAMGRLRADGWIREEADGHLLLTWDLAAARY
ncbi:Crp/Fnr family transcriptional regulator [Gloeobacter violaceus]|uniref:Crp family transcriptional regulatory protein n=1 Tax=Gloeobacter violaceus (strain ATCC 29082 / PCC 7421) TaxID=251221 RepID=Q7MBD1_GLOVI|nr:Crp/Fnr family transcriptional regulator [Gloeobacter violaceus]BAC88249.1 Crp family transcriptional regulatory protein [Gloeobacter violaceus PCC 7421]